MMCQRELCSFMGGGLIPWPLAEEAPIFCRCVSVCVCVWGQTGSNVPSTGGGIRQEEHLQPKCRIRND